MSLKDDWSWRSSFEEEEIVGWWYDHDELRR